MNSKIDSIVMHIDESNLILPISFGFNVSFHVSTYAH